MKERKGERERERKGEKGREGGREREGGERGREGVLRKGKGLYYLEAYFYISVISSLADPYLPRHIFVYYFVIVSKFTHQDNETMMQ